MCAGDFPTYRHVRAACWAQHGRAGDSEAGVTVVAAARKPQSPGPGAGDLGWWVESLVPLPTELISPPLPQYWGSGLKPQDTFRDQQAVSTGSV